MTNPTGEPNGNGVQFNPRPATDADCDFLWHVAATTMRRYVATIWGWDEAWQEGRFRGKFDAARWQVIVVDGQDAGGLALERQGASIVLENLYLLPTFQRRGIGSAVVRGLIEEARTARMALTLDVLRGNPDARRLYERLGLRVVGENKERFFMSTAAVGESGGRP